MYIFSNNIRWLFNGLYCLRIDFKRNRPMKLPFTLPLVILALTSPIVVSQEYHSTDHLSVAMNEHGKKQVHGDAIEIILKDHDHIRGMVSSLEKKLDLSFEESRALFKKLKSALIEHETMEQTVWYTELNKDDNLKTIIASLKEEEEGAAKAIKEIDETRDMGAWTNKVKKLLQAVGNHAKDEETNLFPKVKKHFNEAQLMDIGSKLEKFKNNYKVKN